MSFKIRDEHWEVMMSFLEANKEMALGRFNGPNGRRKLKLLWKELATQLNALGAGERSPDKWQKTWTDFKCLLKKKATTLKDDQHGTGGGPATSTPLNSFQLRALNILGSTFFEGVGASEIVATKTKSTENVEMVPFRIPTTHRSRKEENGQPASTENEPISTTNNEHNYSYSAAPKRKKPGAGVEEAYSETISILRDIKNIVDVRLQEISNSLDRLTSAIRDK